MVMEMPSSEIVIDRAYLTSQYQRLIRELDRLGTFESNCKPEIEKFLQLDTTKITPEEVNYISEFPDKLEASGKDIKEVIELALDLKAKILLLEGKLAG